MLGFTRFPAAGPGCIGSLYVGRGGRCKSFQGFAVENFAVPIWDEEWTGAEAPNLCFVFARLKPIVWLTEFAEQLSRAVSKEQKRGGPPQKAAATKI